VEIDERNSEHYIEFNQGKHREEEKGERKKMAGVNLNGQVPKSSKWERMEGGGEHNKVSSNVA